MPSIIALIGRPNVGKSTIFNLLTNTNSAIVADYPGLTRDRKYGTLKDSSVVLVDTGGIGTDENLSESVLFQTELAIDEADIFLLILDAKEGLMPLDEEIARKLRKVNKKIIAVVNKIDVVSKSHHQLEFNELGFEEVLMISAAHNRGISSLIDYLQEFYLEEDKKTVSPTDLTISIIGRPNVGKSTLLNKFLGKDRAVISDEAGTTRDSVEGNFVYKGKKIKIIDTAGMRRKRSLKELNEKSFVGKSIVSMRNSNLVIILLDGSEALVDQDIHLISLAATLGKSIVIAINKVDILDKDQQLLIKDQIERKLRFASYIKYLFISAKQGKGLGKLLNLSSQAYEASIKDLDTSLLNDILNKAIDKLPPVRSGRFRPKLKFAHPGGKNPPVIVIHGNNLSSLQTSYIKYLENFFREHLKLPGSPLTLKMKDTENPFKDKKNTLTERQKKKRRRIIKKK